MLEKNPDLYYYNNPDTICQDILNHLSETTSGKVSDINTNTTFGFLLDSFTTITSFIVKGIEEEINSIYPKRAITNEDLYKHISDYDYVSFQANPASFYINIKIPKLIIYNSVINYDVHYKALVIPKDTIFKVGNLDFGIYYDIYIKVNKLTKNIIINYDTSEDNPLHELKNYNIPYEEVKLDNLEYISFEIPIFQFSKTQIVEQIDTTIGFTKKYKLTDKFYAVRVYDINNNKELQYTYSDINYDPLYPTCIIKYYPDVNELILNIPLIYFTNHQISSKLFVEIYTTKGKLDINIDTTNPDLIQCAFKNNTSLPNRNTLQPLVNAIKKISSFIMIPINNKIIGGKDIDNFYTIKNNVIHDTFSNRTLISYSDIQNYFNSFGYKVINRIDNLTNRVYYAMRYILDNNNDKLLLVNTKINLDINKIDYNQSKYMNTILKITEKDYTILPNTIYKYEYDRNLASPITNEEYEYLNNLSLVDKINQFNNNEYLFFPYHIKISLDYYYPKSECYDLISCEFTKFNFGNRHPYSEFQTYLNDFQITHLNYGCDKYKILLGINKNDKLKEIPESDIIYYFLIKTTENRIIGYRANLEYITEDGLYVYSVILHPSYRLENNNIGFKNMDYIPGYNGDILVPLETDAYLITYIRGQHLIDSIDYQEYNIFTNHKDQNNIEYIQQLFIDNSYIPIEIFDFGIKLGNNLSDIIDNNILINYKPETYVTYETDIPLTYEHDIYAKDNQGKLIYTIENGEVKLQKLHSQGEIVRDSVGNIIYKHRKGEIKIDTNGNPILKTPREIITNIDTFLISYKHKIDTNFNYNDLISTLYSYLESIREYRLNLYGNTLCYFKPISTLGKGVFYRDNDKTIDLNLNIKVGFKIYVSIEVINDDHLISVLSDNIRSIVKSYLENKIVSLYQLADQIKMNFNEYIKAIDIKGINDDINLQTIIKANDDYDLVINKILTIDNDKNIILEDDIELEYIPINE